jgi:hypothetical protein
MCRREECEFLHGGEKSIVDELGLVERAGMDGLESDSLNLGQILESLAFTGNLRQALANGGRVIAALAARLANPLDMAFCQKGLLRNFQKALLERSDADICNQTFHC